MTTVVERPTGSIDPGVKLPAAVRRNAAKADLIQKETYNPDPPADPNAPANPDPAQPPAPVAQQPDPAQPPAPAQPPMDDATRIRNLEQGLSAMNGRLAKSEREKAGLQSHIAGLERTIATMSAQTPAPAAQPDPALSASSLISPDQREEFGNELIDVAGRAAEERLSPKLKNLEETVGRLSSQIEQSATEKFAAARGALFQYMTDNLPNWEQMNVDDKFLNWLDLSDKFSGVKRADLLKAAYDANDSPRVLAFFKGYLSEEAAVAPAPSVPDTTMNPQTGGEKVDLASLAAPGRAKSPASQTPQSKPIYSRAQIAAFYVDVTAGRYRGKEDEKARIENDIFAAQQEGRVR